MERRDCAAAPAPAAPVVSARAQHTRTGTSMRSTNPEVRGRDHLGMFLNKFWPWACSNRFDTALDSETEVDTSETPRAELERLHGNQLVSDLFLAWEMTTKAIETEGQILDMVMDIRHPSEVWRSLTQMAAQMQDTAYDRAKNELELLEIRVSETVAECFARVYVVLRKLTRQKGKTLARQIKRRVRHGLTLRFPDEVRLCTMKADF